jgi:RNA polymerase sigma-70 factor (ECF subfamily)
MVRSVSHRRIHGNDHADRYRVTERELIRRVLGGDGQAERELYDRHVDRVFRLAYRLADGDSDLARDFAQDVFIRAFDRLAEFRGDSALSTWLHSITVSVALNGMRKVKRWRAREADLNEATTLGSPVGGVEPDLKSRLRAAIAKLPVKYRVVFTMYDVEGYSHDEISSALGMPTGTSKARLARARAKLRAELGQHAGEWVS